MSVRFVEYDDNGDIFHICTVDLSEGPDIAPLPPTADAEARAKRKKDVDDAVAEAHGRVKAELLGHINNGKKLIILDDNDPHPTHEGHKVQGNKIRAMTPAEKNDYAQRHKPTP